MKKLVLILPLLLGGCVTNIFDLLNPGETSIVAIVTDINKGYQAAAHEVDQISTFICGNLPRAQDALVSFKVQVLPTAGPKTRKYVADAEAALTGVNAYCNGSRGTGLQVIVSAYKAFKAAQAAINLAHGAAGK